MYTYKTHGGRGPQRLRHGRPTEVLLQLPAQTPRQFSAVSDTLPVLIILNSIKRRTLLHGLLLLPDVTNIPKMLACRSRKILHQIVRQGCSH